MEKKYLIVFLLFFSLNLSAQYEEFYSNFSSNIINLNPSYAGSRDGLSITNFYRNYWVGIKGSPFVYNKNVHSPIYKDILGAGLSFSYSRMGPTSNTSFYGSFSSTIKLNKEKKHDLRIGLNGGVDIIKNNLLQIGVVDNIDIYSISYYSNQIQPNIGFGFIYEQSNFYFGYSIPKILQNDFDATLTPSSVIRKQYRRHIFITGFLVQLDKMKKVQFKSNILTLLNENSSFREKINMNFEFLKRFWIGSGLEFSVSPAFTGIRFDKLNFLTGVRVGKIIEIGYSFDYNILSQSFKYNGGSHELFLRCDIIYKPKENIVNARWF